MAQPSQGQNSNTQLLQELEALSQSLYTSHTARRTASLALPRSSSPVPVDPSPPPRSRRLSLSPFRSRPSDSRKSSADKQPSTASTAATIASPVPEKKSGGLLKNWKPFRALSRIGMQRMSCLLSAEVVSVQGLPATMNGLRLSVCVRKKETKDGAVQTMPARVLQSAADFEETLFLRCHLYFTHSAGQIKFEPRIFLIYVTAVDAPELNFGQSAVDLSRLVRESMAKNLEGTRIRQWDMSFDLTGKAKGGEIVLKLGFQIMDDKGLGIYSDSNSKLNKASNSSSPSLFARKQSKTSFSVTSPRISSRFEMSTPSADLQGIDDLNLDEPTPPPPPPPPETSIIQSSNQKAEPEIKPEDPDIPDFDVVDKGIEIQETPEQESESEVNTDDRSVSSEVVKEVVVHDPIHQKRLTELDSIAQQIKALESIIGNEDVKFEHPELQGLDAEEETVTREFLQLLEEEENRESKFTIPDLPVFELDNSEAHEESETKAYISDLGKGLGSVVKTRDGGYLVSMNPFDTVLSRKETPKLAMQISKPLVLPPVKFSGGCELFQKMAAVGVDELTTGVLNLTAMDELTGKTAEQIAFEGIASAIINGRNTKEAATSSAAKSISAVKTMVKAVSSGRQERITTGIWNVSEDPLTIDEILAFSLQKIEAMAIEALKIQAEMSEEEPPFDVSPLNNDGSNSTNNNNNLLASAVSLDEWVTSERDEEEVLLLVVVQVRDPLRRYEVVGGPLVAAVQATRVEARVEEEGRYKLRGLHVGGLKVKGRRHTWDSERQRLTAMHWLVGHGMGRKGKSVLQMKGQDLMWSMSARVMADMWLKPTRNPDVKFPKGLQ